MHGVIFAELKKYVDAKLGGDRWNALLRESGFPGKIYLPSQHYSDEEAVALVTAASRLTGTSAARILEDFGEFIVPDLVAMYRTLIRSDWKTLDLIEHTEETIHRVVRIQQPGARPPELKCVRTSPDEVVVTYASPRKMCGVAKGIARGVAKHFKETVTISETSCMLKGGDHCRISVKRVQ